MTDGGVYGNLGLTPLLPGRSRQFTSQCLRPRLHSCRRRRTGADGAARPNFMLGRLKRSFEIAHNRNQDGSRARVHELASAGLVEGVVYSYLGMRDERLPVPVASLVPREAVAAYPTNFAIMTAGDLHMISTRAEQLTGHLSTTTARASASSDAPFRRARTPPRRSSAYCRLEARHASREGRNCSLLSRSTHLSPERGAPGVAGIGTQDVHPHPDEPGLRTMFGVPGGHASGRTWPGTGRGTR